MLLKVLAANIYELYTTFGKMSKKHINNIYPYLMIILNIVKSFSNIFVLCQKKLQNITFVIMIN